MKMTKWMKRLIDRLFGRVWRFDEFDWPPEHSWIEGNGTKAMSMDDWLDSFDDLDNIIPKGWTVINPNQP